MTTVLFLCTGNSIRSQMAEGFAKKLFPEEWTVKSAGTAAMGVNPFAISVMGEKGIDISKQKSKVLSQLIGFKPQVVITLCSHADARCPSFPDKVLREHWDISDPTGAHGDDEAVIAAFRAVRDEIELRVKELAGRIAGK